MEEEMRALDTNKTWNLVDPLQHCKSIEHKWVYKAKYNPNGSVNKYTTRFVAKGYVHTHDETFTLVAKMTTFLVVLAATAARGWHLNQMDVKNTFLQGHLDRISIYGPTPWFSIEDEQIDSMPTKEAVLRPQASPPCLELENHAPVV